MRGTRWLKEPLLRLARKLRAFDAAHTSAWRDQRLLILCFHGIAAGDEAEWNGDLFMPSRVFAERMESLRRHQCSVLPLAEAIDALYRGVLPRRAVVITFDDGFANFHSLALPILAKHGFPASVYVSTYYSERANLPVFPVTCSYLLWKARGGVYQDVDIPGIPRSLDLRTPESRRINSLRIIAYADDNGYSGQAKDELLSQLAARLDQDLEGIRARRTLSLMTPEELLAVSRAGIGIEMHSHAHRILNQRQHFDRDLKRNADLIREWTGVAPTHFCYPGGLVSPEWVEWLRDFDVRSAVTCAPAFASRTDDPLLLPRYVDGSRSTAIEFESWISGFAPLVGRKTAIRLRAPETEPQSKLASLFARPESGIPSDPVRGSPVRNRE